MFPCFRPLRETVGMKYRVIAYKALTGRVILYLSLQHDVPLLPTMRRNKSNDVEGKRSPENPAATLPSITLYSGTERFARSSEKLFRRWMHENKMIRDGCRRKI